MTAALSRRIDAAPRVLIVDDSAVARAVIARAVEAGGGCEVAGAVSTVRAALDSLRAGPVEVILLDVEMPGGDGLTALPELIAVGGAAKVLVISSSCAEGAEATVRALALGAADTLAKPGAGVSHALFSARLAEKLARLLAVEDAPAPIAPPPARAPETSFDLVAIGASTGGIHALGQLLAEVPEAMRTPIMITQHLPAAFMPFFAAQIAAIARRPCTVAGDRERLSPGHIVVAPGDAHLRCTRFADGGIATRLSNERSASGCMPSVDPMFESVAAAFGPRALGVVLTGMGRDGCLGAGLLVKAGAGVIVQDRESSVVWGMPGAVARAGLASAALPPDEIGRAIARGRRPA